MPSSSFYFLVYYYLLVALPCLYDLNSLARDWTQAMTVKTLNPNHWTSREFTRGFFFLSHLSFNRPNFLNETCPGARVTSPV